MAIVGPLPNTISNGQLEDATPVMANFNWLLTQVNSNAAPLSSIPLVVGAYGVRGLTGDNNAGSPTSKMDFSTQLVVLRNVVTNEVAVQVNPSTITNDTGLSGPVANGRDQAAVFPASNWIHFYYIWNGTTLATISSLMAPSGGPALPVGYTSWAYIGAVFFNGSSQLFRVRMRGARTTYDGAAQILVNGSQTSTTAISTAGFVPPNALTFQCRAALSFSDTGTTSSNLNLYLTTALITAQFSISEPVAGVSVASSGTLEMANLGQQIFYAWDTAVGTRNANIFVQSYVVSNGDS